jgi:hypothetical protein
MKHSTNTYHRNATEKQAAKMPQIPFHRRLVVIDHEQVASSVRKRTESCPPKTRLSLSKNSLTARRHTLAVLLKQQALQSVLHAPLDIVNGVEMARENIQRIKINLRALGIAVEELDLLTTSCEQVHNGELRMSFGRWSRPLTACESGEVSVVSVARRATAQLCGWVDETGGRYGIRRSS